MITKRPISTITLIAGILACAMFFGGCNDFINSIKDKAGIDDEEEIEEEEDEEEETSETEETEESAESSEPEETEVTETTAETTETEVTETTAAKITIDTYSDGFPKAYLPIIDECLYHLSGNIAEDDMMTMMGIDEYVMYYDYSEDKIDPLDCFGYELIDLNNDTVPELLVIESVSEGDICDHCIVGAYTIKDGNAVMLFEGFARDRYYLTEDLDFIENGSNGAAYSIWNKHRLNANGEFETVESYFTDYSVFDAEGNADTSSKIAWYKSNDGVYSANKGDCDFYCDLENFDMPFKEYQFRDNEITQFIIAEHRYEVIIDDLKFDEAKAACEKRGGHLVAIESEQEAAVVKKFMSYNYADEKMLFTGAEDGVWPNGEKVGKFLFPEGKVIRDGYLGATISGQDGSLILVEMSSDPMGEEYYYSGFIGYIYEFEPS